MLKNAFWLFLITLFVLVSFLPSYTKMQDLRQKNTDYAGQINALKQKHTALVEERTLLEEDPAYLEKVARDKMGLIREGEVVYEFTPANAEE